MDGLFRFSVAGAVVIYAGLVMSAERQPYERYQSIVDRQMFGAPPPGFDPTKPPSEVSKADAREAEAQLTKEQEQIRSAIHFSVINVTPSGETAVGFTDNGDSKNPVHYYLKVGEQRNGWLVKEADPVKATMTIAKGEVEVSLSIGGNSAKGGAVAKSAAAGTATATASILPALANDGTKPGVLVNRLQSGGGTQLNSLRSRRLLREQQRQQEAAEREAEQVAAEERRREDEARREEERLQREAEREEQRVQLQQIKEELRKAREEREATQQQEQTPPPPDFEEGPPPPDFE
ncbi:MAG: hypothetical protein IKO87_01260 [Kiritimatiellae bacterium]|nr:hypothetical protein [Kiritimatiellia bacterium]MBR4476151.1 hypothetical protein [Kiritimatiellia bacterium]